MVVRRRVFESCLIKAVPNLFSCEVSSSVFAEDSSLTFCYQLSALSLLELDSYNSGRGKTGKLRHWIANKFAGHRPRKSAQHRFAES